MCGGCNLVACHVETGAHGAVRNAMHVKVAVQCVRTLCVVALYWPLVISCSMSPMLTIMDPGHLLLHGLGTISKRAEILPNSMASCSISSTGTLKCNLQRNFMPIAFHILHLKPST